MELYPAIDIRDGGAVRLVQGDFERQHDYGDPVALARRFAAEGARWLHVVDLDAARAGKPVNRSTVLAIAAAVDVPVQSGGGVRTDADVDELLEGGVARVVLGTAALTDPELASRLAGGRPGRVAVGIDYRMGVDGRSEVAVRGWAQGSGRTVEKVVDGLAGTGVAAVVVTAIDRDGTLEGPDLDGLYGVLARTDLPVIASGGVGSVEDIVALAQMDGPAVGDGASAADRHRRLAGVVCGKALVDGRLTVGEGVKACARCG
jgi:phosphoribosylformimino-5-aminoimidazole carboxamide ribotide isomerase